MIKVRRGEKASLPTTAGDGQPIFTEDTNELFFGTDGPGDVGPLVPLKIDASNIIGGGGGGDTPSLSKHYVSAASTNHRLVASGPGVVWKGVSAENASAGFYPVYIKVYDLDHTPVPGVDDPFATIGVQAGSSRDVWPPGGRAIDNDLHILITKGITDADNVAVANGDLALDVYYTT